MKEAIEQGIENRKSTARSILYTFGVVSLCMTVFFFRAGSLVKKA